MAFKFLPCAFALFSFAPYFFFVGAFVSFYSALLLLFRRCLYFVLPFAYFCFSFASMHSVAWGTARSLSFAMSFPVSRHIPYVLFSILTSAA